MREVPRHVRLNEIFSNVVEAMTEWQAHQDSNPGPADLESAALPTELYAYIRKRTGNVLRSILWVGKIFMPCLVFILVEVIL